MSDEIHIWRTAPTSYMVCAYAEDVPTVLRAMAFGLENRGEVDYVAALDFGLSDEEGYLLTAVIEGKP